MVLNSSFFAESKVRAPTVSNCFPLHFQKKMGLRGKFFCKQMADWQFWHDHAGPLPTVSDCFRPFPTVSVSLERQLDLWTTDSTKITTFNTFPHDPSARRLLEMMHFDFETQYTLKIPQPQDLVKFNNISVNPAIEKQERKCPGSALDALWRGSKARRESERQFGCCLSRLLRSADQGLQEIHPELQISTSARDGWWANKNPYFLDRWGC